MARKQFSGKRGQLQMGETIFVVFFILIIIVFGLVFYGNDQQGKMKEQALELSRENLVSQAHTIAWWPELECSSIGVRKFDCIDKIKLELLSGFINDSKAYNSFGFRYYSDLLGRSTIIVEQIYPPPTAVDGPWIIYNNSGNRSSKETIFNPLNIYDPESKLYSFGIMEISTYD